MTAKQRAARAKFKAVVKEATKLRKKNPKLTQAEAVKQAWAISYSKEGKGKKLGYSKEREKLHKNATAWLKKRKKLDADKSKKDRVSLAYQQATFGKPTVGAIKKKAATKVKAKKRAATEMHTDTKSHNVNIRVVSGLPRAKKFIKIPSKQKTWFRYYVNGFYGKKGVQSSALKNNGFTRAELNRRLNMFFKIQHEKGVDSWNGGDSIDRERFRDMFLMDQVKKGVTIY